MRCYTVPEAAKLLSLPVSRVYELVRKRQLPSIKQGKYVRIPAAALADYIRAQTVPVKANGKVR